MDGQTKLLEYCKAVLDNNSVRGGWTKPAPNLYPHQWLWDSCFIAIGLRHHDIKRAQKEVKNLFRGQWKNGMIPNIIYGADERYGDDIWKSKVSKDAPRNLKTSGITQPPMLAEAIVKIGELLNQKDRKKWYKDCFESLVRYHEWLYRERGPRNDGIVTLVHPWESGLDNSPVWMSEMHQNQLPLWIKTFKFMHLHNIFNAFRRNTKYLPAYERIDVIDALGLYSAARRLRRKQYNTTKILRHTQLCIEDLAFNSILIRANTHLEDIAKEINQEIPGWLRSRIKKTPHSLELLWDESTQQYLSRNYSTFELIKEPTIMTFLPLYAGTISASRAKKLVELLKSRAWSTKFLVPTAPKNSKFFSPTRYWQGPVWINTNWLIADGLKRYGYVNEANEVIKNSVTLVNDHGSYEYFSPLDGRPSGAHPFSWTAALTIDFLKSDT